MDNCNIDNYTNDNVRSEGITFSYNGYELRECFSKICLSMLLNENFRKLSHKQQILLIYCHNTIYSSFTKPSVTHPDLRENGTINDDCFYMNFGLVKFLGLYSDNSKSSFIKDMKALIDNGFIDVAWKKAKEKNIYKLSSRWRTTKENVTLYSKKQKTSNNDLDILDDWLNS